MTTTEATLALVTRFENEFDTRDRACCRWLMRWNDADGNDVALRGVDVISVRDGKIAENLTYGTP